MTRLLSLWLILPLLTGCAGMYFHDAGEPPRPAPRYALEDLPYEEYWTGLVFNGNKIGFTHFSISPLSEAERLYELRAHAAMHFRFLAIDKRVVLKSNDLVHADLGIQSIHGEYDLDGNRLEVAGTMTAEGLSVTIKTRDEVREETLPVQGKLYPSSVIGLYPILHGLEVGRHYAYEVYDGETQSIATVTQAVLAYEGSELFDGHAFKIRTRLHGQEVTTWMSTEGLPLLEMSVGGVFIAGLESEDMARRYLARAALNKQESLLAFSRVPTEPSIPRPRAVSSMTVEIRGLNGFGLPSDALQRCHQQDGEARCEIRTASRVSASAAPVGEVGSRGRYLQSTVSVPSRHAGIRDLAKDITEQVQDKHGQIALLVDWIQVNVESQAVDSFSALDVLATRKAECQGNTYLYAAFARSLGIPTRVVNGLVYSDTFGDGFLYHTWAESHLEGRWIPVDPTFGQVSTDATHIKLLEGESLVELAPMVSLMGNLKATVIKLDYHP